jgi:predicted ester cyclase
VSVEENMALGRLSLEARGKGDLDALEHMMAPDFVDHALAPSQEPDREGYKRRVAEYSAAFSNVRFIIEDQKAAGDKVVTRFTVSATHARGELMGVAPTGRELTDVDIVILRISEGKVAEEWGVGTSISEVREGFVARCGHLEQERIEREYVEHELRVARRIQQASLPKEVRKLEAWEITPFYRPAREVGGDFYDFHPLPEGRLGLAVGDATGKGVPARLLWSCPPLAARCASQPRATPHLERYFSELARRSIPTSRPTCSSPASMVSSTLVAVASPTPTRATISPTCGMVGKRTN